LLGVDADEGEKYGEAAASRPIMGCNLLVELVATRNRVIIVAHKESWRVSGAMF